MEILLRDTGPGIADEERLTVFQPFYSGWRHLRSRPGMGLTIALEIVRQHGGEIHIESHNAGGCTVHLYLPLNPSAELLRSEND